MALWYTHVVRMIGGDELFHYERQLEDPSARRLACNDRSWGRIHRPAARVEVDPRANAPTCLWCVSMAMRRGIR